MNPSLRCQDIGLMGMQGGNGQDVYCVGVIHYTIGLLSVYFRSKSASAPRAKLYSRLFLQFPANPANQGVPYSALAPPRLPPNQQD